MKFFRRLFVFLLLATGITAGIGYYQGYRLDDVERLISEFSDQYFPAATDSPDPEGEISPDTAPLSHEAPKPSKKSKPSSPTAAEFQPLPPNPFAKIDRRARNSPSSVEGDIITLSEYLAEGANSDLEKARSIYVWLTHNVYYDDAGYNSGNYSDVSADGVLVNRKAVCSGFSNLYYELGDAMGLEIQKVRGFAKGYGFTQGDRFEKTNHAWNIIKINGQWRIFDATWGRGHGETVNGKLSSIQEFNDFWFNVDPYDAIFTHLPENSAQAFVSPGIGLRQYESLPYVRSTYFKFGFDGKKAYRTTLKNPSFKFPESYSLQTHVKVLSAPIFDNLVVGKVYPFELYVPRGIDVAIHTATGQWTYFDRDKGHFKIHYQVEEPGVHSVGIKYENGENTFHTILAYDVSPSNIQ